MGCDCVEGDCLRRMREAGVEVDVYHLHARNLTNVNQRAHRKLLVIDGRQGFTGGVGIADNWLGNADAPDHWRDSHYKLEGPMVAQMQAAFMDNWMFCVQDTGPGLNDDVDAAPLAHQIHESALTAQTAEESHPEDRTAADIAKAPTSPFLTEAPSAGGIPGEGVGLSIVKRLSELLDASLELETTTGKGSTFRVILPRYYEAGK